MNNQGFDRSLLPTALFEFAIISDGHYMLDLGPGSIEFEQSRRQQSKRLVAALDLASELKADFIIHLGDLVQEPEDSPRFNKALDEADAIFARSKSKIYYVAGNQDAGDKPDPTMPSRSVTRESLERFHTRYGNSWYSFDHKNCHFVIVNAMLFNSALSDAAIQQDWLEKDLAQNKNQRIFLFCHLPLYLWNQSEPGLGHYDNIDQPARAWLLKLIRKYQIEFVLSGHTHFAFHDQIDNTRFYVLASPAFTRPGFSQIFSAPPPPDRGRDDTPKMGIYLFRVRDDRVDIYFIRSKELNREKQSRLLISPSRPGNSSLLGITLRQSLMSFGELYASLPATKRERIRNDYPSLLLQELGNGWLRTSCDDLGDGLQSQRLKILRKGGMNISAICLGIESLKEFSSKYPKDVDQWEFHLPGCSLPNKAETEELKNLSKKDFSLAICPVIPGEVVPGKHMRRTRIGYNPSELGELDTYLKTNDIIIHRALCRIPRNKNASEFIKEITSLNPLQNIKGIDLLLDLPVAEDWENMNLAAEALTAVTSLPGTRLFIEPLIDLDRAMDVYHGLLDLLCNPRPVFSVLKTLNAILFSSHKTFHFSKIYKKEIEGWGLSIFETDQEIFVLALPKQTSIPLDLITTHFDMKQGLGKWISIYFLKDETVLALDSQIDEKILKSAASQPLLLVFKRK